MKFLKYFLYKENSSNLKNLTNNLVLFKLYIMYLGFQILILIKIIYYIYEYNKIINLKFINYSLKNIIDFYLFKIKNINYNKKYRNIKIFKFVVNKIKDNIMI